jgi:5'-3' exoribonuclease 1
MGIPSYFSYIIKKYPSIVSKLNYRADNFYLDSNSIIYDMVAKMGTVDESILIQRVCQKIDEYLTMVQPKRVFIAFDGIPPMAKIKQQRDRRYKSWILQNMSKKSEWNTIQITPGTTFMNKLNTHLKEHFQQYDKKYDFFKLSTSEEYGEGEHKLFEHIRNNPQLHKTTQTLIYGLDSDLIVLSLHHLQYGTIQLLRESPAFMLSGDDMHVLDVPKLAEGIKEIVGEDRMGDYIFMTFFLGNDFMPHFPALNLRTRGFDLLLYTYNACVLPYESLVTKDRINWGIVQKLITGLAEREHSAMTSEYHSRNRFIADTSTEEAQLNNTPMIKREKELFICPIRTGWENRYYHTLLKTTNLPIICKHFTDMLEWNMLYYTTGCVNWQIYYPYMYPPLLSDLKHYVPKTSELEYNQTRMQEKDVLRYVLPTVYHSFIPGEQEKDELVPTLEWSYCRYIWESHVCFV